MSNAEKIQLVMNTIELITIPATYDNVNRITGIYNTLAEVRNDLQKPAEEQDEVTEDG